MFHNDKYKFLNTFITCEAIDEDFDYSLDEKSSSEQYLVELKKFNSLYKNYFINSYLVLKDKDLIHIMKLFFYFKKNNSNNCYLISEFLLSYFNSINNKEYKIKVSNYKDVRNSFKSCVLQNNKKENVLSIFKNITFDLYNKIIDYGLTNKDCFLGDILERSCINFRNDKVIKKKLIKKYLENNIYPSKVIIYDENIKENFKYYEKYLLDYETYNVYSMFPNEMINILDKKGLLNNKIIKTIINKTIDRTNIIQDKCLDETESFIQIIAEIEETKNFLNFCLNKLTMLSSKHKNKIHECLINLLYLKRSIISNEERMKSQMQCFEYRDKITDKEINEIADLINNNIANLYLISVGNFEKEMGEALENYAKYPLGYITNSYNIDSTSQTYIRSEEGFVDSTFMKYYDEIGKEYTFNHRNMQNILMNDYYVQMLKYMKDLFNIKQLNIISFFDIKYGKNALINKLIAQGDYQLKNEYIILALNTMQIENSIIELLKINNKKVLMNGFDNLNELAKLYINNKYYINGLMYINYVLYERQGLNIRNNIAHGNYFAKNIDVELLTSFCSLMFLNGLLRKENGKNARN